MTVLRVLKSIGVFVLLLVFCQGEVLQAVETKDTPPVVQLKKYYAENAAFRQTIADMFAGLAPIVEGKPNPWIGKNINDLYDFVNRWYYFLPITTNGLRYIREFQSLYADNPAGLKFIHEEPGFSWIKTVVECRGSYMDSSASVVEIPKWKADPRIGMQDFVEPEGGYKSFNEFFTRPLKPGARPIDGANEDYVIVSPADSIIEIINVELTADAQIPTKEGEWLNVRTMLDGSSFADQFIGGKLVRCILEPTSYHHYHAPVSGLMLESKEHVNGSYFDQRVLKSGERYHRGYFIFQTPNYGKVAMIAFGLATINSVKFEEPFANVSKDKPVPVEKGTRLGHFAYGGSMIFLLFEKDRLESLGVRQGQRIGVFDRNPEPGK